MPITVDWDNEEKTRILITYVDPWDLSEYIQTSKEANDLLATVSHRVDILSDMLHCKTPPAGILSNATRVYTTAQPNLGVTVVATTHLNIEVLSKGLQSVASKTPAKNMYLVSSLEEGRALLRKLRGSESSSNGH